MMVSKTKEYGFFAFLWHRFQEARILQAAGSLTFTTLLALVPLLTVMLVVMTTFPVFEKQSDHFIAFINGLFVPEGASVMIQYLQEFEAKAGKLTAAGIVVMALSALMLMQTIERTFDGIWRVHRQRPLLMRFCIYWAILTLAPVLIGTGISFSQYMSTWFPMLSGQLHMLWALILDIILLFCLYYFVPNSRVVLWSALLGALLAGILLEATKWGFAMYVHHFNNYHLIYGAFAAIPLFLMWLNLLWNIILGGAVLTATLSSWKKNRYITDIWQNHFDAAVQILMLLKSAQMDGKAINSQDFRKRIDLDSESLHGVLSKLAQYDYVSVGENVNSWLLKTSPEQIILKDLFEHLVYAPALEGGDVARGLRQLISPSLENLNLNLVQFEQRLLEADTSIISDKVLISDTQNN